MVGVGLALGGCGRTEHGDAPGTADADGASAAGGAGGSVVIGSGGAMGSVTGTTSSGPAAGGVGGEQVCQDAFAQKRLVRLTFFQIIESVEAMFGAELAARLKSEFDLDPNERDELPLLSSRESATFSEAIWADSDAIAQAVGQHVEDDFARVTGCSSDPSQACATQYLLGLAQQAYRRPVTAAEQERLLRVMTEVLATDASVQVAAGYGVYALLSAPQFLYRSEFGSAISADEELTALEQASQLAYFLTDAPPDAELLAAAEQGALADSAAVREQARRLLAEPETQENLALALDARFGISNVDNVVIDPAVAPEFDETLRDSMQREGRWLTRQSWEGGAVEDLITTRESYVNEALASLYGLEFRPADSTLDADGFTRVLLPAERSGLLTNAAALTAGSRPDAVSVVNRGLQVIRAFSCDINPPFPEQSEIPEIEIPADASEREKAEIRMQTPACAECHTLIDPYGLALFGFDVIGRFRTTDPEGQPIDTSVTMPDGSTVEGAVGLAAYLALDNKFAACLASYWIQYALAEPQPLPADGCATRSILLNFDETSRSLTDLIVEIAASPALMRRRGGTAP